MQREILAKGCIVELKPHENGGPVLWGKVTEIGTQCVTVDRPPQPPMKLPSRAFFLGRGRVELEVLGYGVSTNEIATYNLEETKKWVDQHKSDTPSQ